MSGSAGAMMRLQEASGGVMDVERQLRLADLNARYAETIDDDRLEEWPDFFAEDGRYRITTAENFSQELPLSLVYATSRAMLRDRINALRGANIYEPQSYRHMIGSSRVIKADGARVATRTSFMVARIMATGETTIFASGRYEDIVAHRSDGAMLFAERIVVLDSRAIDTLLAIPI